MTCEQQGMTGGPQLSSPGGAAWGSQRTFLSDVLLGPGDHRRSIKRFLMLTCSAHHKAFSRCASNFPGWVRRARPPAALQAAPGLAGISDPLVGYFLGVQASFRLPPRSPAARAALCCSSQALPSQLAAACSTKPARSSTPAQQALRDSITAFGDEGGVIGSAVPIPERMRAE